VDQEIIHSPFRALVLSEAEMATVLEKFRTYGAAASDKD